MRIALLLALFVCLLPAQTGLRDRYFARYPFERWQSAGDTTQIRWTVRTPAARLTPYQRLAARIEIELDEKEIVKRRGHGELATLLQIEDASGKRWRTHNSFDLTRVPAETKVAALAIAQEVFLLPGDYTISVATCDSQTGEHSFLHRLLRVPPLHADPLPDAWEGLPPVEFVRAFQEPDSWFQPSLRGRLRLGLQTSRPIHIDVLLNLTPSERAANSTRSFRRNMTVLIPALKVLSGIEIANGSLDVTLLDLTRREVSEEKNVRGLDWMKAKSLLSETQPGVIDLQSLSARGQMTQFFRDQVLSRVRGADGNDEMHVVIVLSAPAFYPRQNPLEPVVLEHDTRRKIFYLRYLPTPRVDLTMYTPGREPAPTGLSLPPDDLERLLKPLDARILHAETPAEFRKALAAMLAEIRRM
jgi:hypothetical protein